MIPVLLILIPLLGGLSAFFIKNEKSSRIWTLLISLIVLVFGVYGVTLKAGADGLTYNGELAAGSLGSLNAGASLRFDLSPRLSLISISALSFSLVSPSSSRAVT